MKRQHFLFLSEKNKLVIKYSWYANCACWPPTTHTVHYLTAWRKEQTEMHTFCLPPLPVVLQSEYILPMCHSSLSGLQASTTWQLLSSHPEPANMKLAPSEWHYLGSNSLAAIECLSRADENFKWVSIYNAPTPSSALLLVVSVI